MSDHAIAAAVSRGLASLGMPSPQRNCQILVQWEGERCGVAVIFPTLGVKYAGESSGGVFMTHPLIPTAVVTHDSATTATNSDLMFWAEELVPREALWRVRANLAEKQQELPHRRQMFEWPFGWPRVNRPLPQTVTD